jgi:Abortive infection alpha
MSEELVPRQPDWEPRREAGARDVIVGAVRFAAGAWVRTTTWSFGASIRVARAATDPQAASDLANDLVEGLREATRELLGVSDPSLERRIKRLLPPSAAPVEVRVHNGAMNVLALREQGAQLLRAAANVDLDDSAHPAFAEILLQLAPDEARILKLLATKGPQPAVDVRSTKVIGAGAVVAAGLNMIGPEAGARHNDRVETYMLNLSRLGLARFSDKPIEDEITYQVLEAQPHVLEAVRDAQRARTVQRSIRLTGFGEDFCRVCLPTDADEIEFAAPDQDVTG